MMKKLLFILLTLVSFESFGQYIESDGSFSKTYTRVRGWKNVEGDWIYDDGNEVVWQIILNVDFFSSPDGVEMFGTILLDGSGEPQYFCNYVGQLKEGEDEFGEYGEYAVDVLSKNDKTGKWDFWDAGALRYYGPWTSLYLGYPPYTYQFSYFGLKE